MYSNYFGLSEPPFAIVPDPRFLYMSEQHREALAHLLYGISSNGGFVLLTGEVGTGKTTVSRCLLEQLPENTDVAFVLNPKFDATELLAAICDDLGVNVPKDGSLKTYVDCLNERLLENHAVDKHTVLIIDEAQNLSDDVLETIRLLTNLETNTQKLLQIILIGQPELTENLAKPTLRQLNQRITARYHLRALTQEELPAYIAHRLSVAGVDCQLFPDKVLRKLFRMTKGVPRLINIICDRALLGAYVQRENRVESNTLNQAAHEVLGQDTELSTSTFSPLKVAAVCAAIAVVIAAGVYIQPIKDTVAAVLADRSEVHVQTVQPVAEAQVTPDVSSRSEEIGLTVSSGEELSNPANWQWPTNTDTRPTEVQAYKQLMQTWNLSYRPQEQPQVCKFAEKNGLRCLFNIGSLDELINLNRPAVVGLFNAKGQSFFATLLTVRGEIADVAIAGEVRQVKVDDLKLWLSGVYTVIWKVPQYYKKPIHPGIEGPEVIWLDRQLALIQNRPPRYFRLNKYDAGLVRQVKRFQEQNGLVADGVVGPHTAILLNAASATETPQLKQKGA